MNYSYLFSDNDELAYQLLKLMLVDSNQTLVESKVIEDLRISSYLLNKLIEGINNDLQKISTPEHPIYLNEPEKNILRGNQLTTQALNKLALMFLERSNNFKIFEYHAFECNIMAKTTFMKAKFISNTAYYTNERELFSKLKSRHITSDSLNESRKEYDNRLYLFQIYYTAYNGIKSPMSDLDPAIDHVIDDLRSTFNINFLPTGLNKLSIFLKVWLKRLQNQDELQKGVIQNIDDQLYDQLTPIFTYLERKLSLKLGKYERNFLYSFLVIQKYINTDLTTLKVDATQQAKTLSTAFMKQLNQQAILNPDSTAIPDALYNQIFEINLQFLTFYIEPSTFVDTEQVTFFEESYPLFNTVVVNYLHNLINHFNIEMSDDSVVGLYFSYMFAMIDLIEPTDLIDVVRICVDFSQGELYTNYIIKTLESFSNVYIEVQHALSANTDLYLSDYESSFINHRQVIWVNPPSPTDWQLLADKIISIKKQKAASQVPHQKEVEPHEWSR